MINNDNDKLDIYLPWLIRCFQGPNEGINTLRSFQRKLKERLNIELPEATIKTILERNSSHSSSNPGIFSLYYEDNGFLKIGLSDIGNQALNRNVKKEREINRTRTLFIKEFIDFTCDSNGNARYRESEVMTNFENFIYSYLKEISLSNNENFSESLNKGDLNEFTRDIIVFLDSINESNNELASFYDMYWKGAVISSDLATFQSEDKLEPLKVFLDTNFLISLLGYHNKALCKEAKQLFSYLKKRPNVEIFIYSITVREVISIFEAFVNSSNYYGDYEINSAFYYMKAKGLTRSKIQRMVDGFEDTILREKYGILVEKVEYLDEDTSEYNEIFNALYESKEYINDRRKETEKKSESSLRKSTEHDVSAILHTIRRGNRDSRSFDNKGAIFLTSSFWLHKAYSFVRKYVEPFQSVMLDSTLTNILFLLNPAQSDLISVEQIMKAHSQHLIIDDFVWKSYILELTELYKDKLLTDKDLRNLLSGNEIVKSYLIRRKSNEISQSSIMELLQNVEGDHKQEKDELQKQISNKELENIELHKNLEKSNELIEAIKNDNELFKNEISEKFIKLEEDAQKDEKWREELDKLHRVRTWILIFTILSFALFFAIKQLPENIETKNFEYLIFLIPFLRAATSFNKAIPSFGVLSTTFKQGYKKEFMRKA
ncbi:MAG: hypothetical protein AAF960_20725 [Bacteroidota bacterium]